MKFRLLILLVFFTLLCATNYGQKERGVIIPSKSAKVPGNTYAIIIGISDYKVVPDLQFADKDARAFENFLLSDAGSKVPKTNIETFTNENATKANIADAISVLVDKAKPGDRAYFFFAGHGDMEVKTQLENGLLLLYNSPNGRYFGMKDDVLEIFELKRYFSQMAENGIEVILIVDACHAGNLKGGIKGVEQTGIALAAAWGKEFKILSCQPRQLSLESAEWGGGRGLFSYELEKGIKGLADADKDGTVTMYELQRFIQDSVKKYSESKQMPFITGDLDKPIATVNPAILAALKDQLLKQRPALPPVNSKGTEESYLDTLDGEGKKIYASYKKNIATKKLIWPKDTNALFDYRQFIKKYPDNELIPLMRRNLASALNQRFDSIVAPLLRGESSYSNRDECYYAAAELDSCMHLLGEQHYMYANLKARKLYMDAMAITWAISESEYNISLQPAIQKAIALLEQSATLEPNAAYTVEALGTRYLFMYEYDKAFQNFQKYLDLQPADFYARYSLGKTYLKLKQYEKAQSIFSKMLKEYPHRVSVYLELFDAYFEDDKKKEALACAKQIRDSADFITGVFTIGVYYSKINQIDSAVHYYQLSKNLNPRNKMSDNNIGYIYLVNKQTDSARFYFNRLVAADSTDPYPNFNLATIDAMNGNYHAAINRFITTIGYTNSFDKAFIAHYEMYYNKQYNHINATQYKEFQNRVFSFEIQYASFLSILYCYLRDSTLSEKTDKIDLIFSRMHAYKGNDVFTWYHHACYSALKKDKTGALESLEKSLKLGFGTYFMLASDADLDFIRNEPEFKNLLQKYFPNNPKKKKQG